jgi:hypothetical protein
LRVTIDVDEVGIDAPAHIARRLIKIDHRIESLGLGALRGYDPSSNSARFGAGFEILGLGCLREYEGRRSQ